MADQSDPSPIIFKHIKNQIQRHFLFFLDQDNSPHAGKYYIH